MVKILTTIIRVILGLGTLVFGLNGFFLFMPMPAFPGMAGEFIAILATTKYLLVVQSLVLVVTGVMFLLNKYVALASVLLFPFTLNWMLFHIFLHLSSIAGALLMFILNLYLLSVNLDKYRPMLKA